VRMLLRYRRRFEFAWQRTPLSAGTATGAAAGLGGALLASLIAAAVLLPSPRADAAGGGAGAAAAWLRGAQNEDGGFGFNRGEDSSPAMTGWAALGLEAADINPLDLDGGDTTPISYLAGTVGQIRTTGDLERTILVLRGAGLDPRHFHGHDLAGRLLARRGAAGSWGGQVNLTAFGVFALRAAGVTSGNARSAGWLRDQQNSDGGWGFVASAASDADSTGAVLQALAAAGKRAGIRRGVSYLRTVQRAGGGFPLNGGAVNAQSTAYAVQGLVAAGVSPSSLRRRGRSPLDYLASVQARDGRYRYSASSDQTPVWVTAQALLAVSGTPFPLNPVPREASAVSTGAAGTPPGARSPSAGAPKGKAAPSGKPKDSQATDAGTTTPTESPPLAPASSAGDSQGDDGGLPGWLTAIVAVALLGGGIWGGWVLYSRHLPG